MASEQEASSSEPEPALAGEQPNVILQGDAVSQSEPEARPRAIGQWATIGWTAICVLAMAAAPELMERIFPFESSPRTAHARVEEMFVNGNLLAASTLASTAFVIALVALPVKLRGWRLRDYLALTWPRPRAVLLAFAGAIALCVASDLLSYSLGRPLVPEIMVDFYRHAWLPFLIVAVVAVGPIGEEILFRGFLYRGIAESRAGPVGAVFLSSFVFAVLHMQYDRYGIALVAAMGLYLGFVRYKIGSVPLVILLHATQNAIGTIEVFVQEHWLW